MLVVELADFKREREREREAKNDVGGNERKNNSVNYRGIYQLMLN